MKINQIGRSMVEMLGVLAIVGILSVGSIAGYSVAMRKYKLNKFINEQTYLINGLIQHDSLRKLSADGQSYNLTDYVKKLNLIPSNVKTNSYEIYFDLATAVIRTRFTKFVIDYYLMSGNNLTKFDDKICFELVSNLAVPLRDSLNYVWLYRGEDNSEGGRFYGKSCSTGQTCLKDITQTQIHDLCSKCIKDSNCIIVFDF